jgi:hypothetical protein
VAVQESLKMTWANQALKSEVRRHAYRSFSFRVSSHQASVPIILVCFLLLAASSSQCPQTPRCQHQLVLSRQLTSKPSWSSPQAQAQVPQLLQGRFGSQVKNGGRTCDPDYGSSATIKHLLHFTYEFVVLA